MNTKIGVTLTAFLLALTLTGCGNGNPTPTPTETDTPVVDVPSTPTPKPTETTPPATEVDTVEPNSEGKFVLPDGTTMDCDDTAVKVVKFNDEWMCVSEAGF